MADFQCLCVFVRVLNRKMLLPFASNLSHINCACLNRAVDDGNRMDRKHATDAMHLKRQKVMSEEEHSPIILYWNHSRCWLTGGRCQCVATFASHCCHFKHKREFHWKNSVYDSNGHGNSRFRGKRSNEKKIGTSRRTYNYWLKCISKENSTDAHTVDEIFSQYCRLVTWHDWQRDNPKN